VMERGDDGSGCVEPMVELRALTSFVFEFLSQSGNLNGPQQIARQAFGKDL